MRFDSSKNAGFSSSDKTFLPTLTTDETVEEEEKDPYSLLNEIKKLISIRKEKEDLRSEEFEMLAGKMAYKRGKIVVLINLFDKEQSFSLKGRYKPIYSLERVSNVGDDFVLAPHGGAILEEID
jgi:glycosidase